jgi:hypothetical protein
MSRFGETYLLFVDIFRDYYFNNRDTIHMNNKCENPSECNNVGKVFLATYPKFHERYMFYVCAKCAIKMKRIICRETRTDDDAREPRILNFNPIFFELFEQINFDMLKKESYQIELPLQISNENTIENLTLGIFNSMIENYMGDDIEFENIDKTITSGNLEDEFIMEHKIKLTPLYIIHSYIRCLNIYDIENMTNYLQSLINEVLIEHINISAINIIRAITLYLNIHINELEWLNILRFWLAVFGNEEFIATD